jgi:catechol 2,3-dioxygenase-like lactoylglutathione lyase family enzyme
MAVVRYLVHDVDAALAFYTEHFGFGVQQRWGPAFAILKRDDLQMWLSGPASSAARDMPDGRSPAPGGWNRVVVEVDDIDEAVARLTEAGVTLRNDVVRGPGGAQILAEDPSGNPVELFQAD